MTDPIIPQPPTHAEVERDKAGRDASRLLCIVCGKYSRPVVCEACSALEAHGGGA